MIPLVAVEVQPGGGLPPLPIFAPVPSGEPPVASAWQACDPGGVGEEHSRWWTFRPAQNRSASVYRCPFCEGKLTALSEHMLITPEGDASRRRHAHRECVLRAREEGHLPTRDEWQGESPERRRWWRRLWGRP